MSKITINSSQPVIEKEPEEPPPVLKSWRNLYLLVLANLIFWIIMFTLFTILFK